jgi:hypothetical protein
VSRRSCPIGDRAAGAAARAHEAERDLRRRRWDRAACCAVVDARGEHVAWRAVEERLLERLRGVAKDDVGHRAGAVRHRLGDVAVVEPKRRALSLRLRDELLDQVVECWARQAWLPHLDRAISGLSVRRRPRGV